MNKIDRSLQGDAIYQISKLYPFEFHRRRTLKLVSVKFDWVFFCTSWYVKVGVQKMEWRYKNFNSYFNQ